MSAQPRAIHKTEEGRKAGRLNFLCSADKKCAFAAAARVRARVGAPAKGRFVVALAGSTPFRAELRKALPKPVGRNRVILDAAPRRAGAQGRELDLERLAQRAWFYRRLGATHLVLEADLPKGEEMHRHLVQLLRAFAPLAEDERMVIDLVVPAQAAQVLKNEWLLPHLLERVEAEGGRPVGRALIRVEQVAARTAESDDESDGAGALLPLVPGAQPDVGQLGLL